jgi:hypothetical protein
MNLATEFISQTRTRRTLRRTFLVREPMTVRAGRSTALVALIGILPSFTSCLAQGRIANRAPAGCVEPDTSGAWAKVLRSWKDERGTTWSNDSLRRVLIAMEDSDQAERVEFGRRWSDSAYAHKLARADSSRARELENIIDVFGLPGRRLVGARGSDAAMVIVQHNRWLEAPVLSLARVAPEGEVSPERLALLEDRVAVYAGKPQLFGTQFSASNAGSFRFDPVTDPASLEARRARAGLPPMGQYVCALEKTGLKIDHSSLPKE